MFCKNCGKNIKGSEKFCIHCGALMEEQNKTMIKNRFAIIKSPKFIFPIFIIGIGILISASIFFGVFDKFFIGRTFEKAFFYRTVGNCDEFVQYMAVDKDKWLDRCIKEKERDNAIPIKDFEILRIDRQPDRAFLQVQLTREKDPYTAHYEMIREGWKWKIVNEI